MTPDPVIRVLLGLILACLVVLVVQGFGAEGGSSSSTSSPLVASLDGAPESDPGAAPGQEEREPSAREAKKNKKKKKPAVQLKPPPAPPLPKPRPVRVNPQTEIEALQHALDPENPQSIRIWAAEQLGTQSSEQAVPVLRETLGDSDTGVVVAAIRALRDSKDPNARAAIEPMLSHQNPKVQQAARQALEAE